MENSFYLSIPIFYLLLYTRKVQIPRVLTCIPTGLQMSLLDIPYLTVLVQRPDQQTKLLNAKVSLLLYHVLGLTIYLEIH